MTFLASSTRPLRTLAALAVVTALLIPGSIHLEQDSTRTIELRSFDISPDCKESLFQE